jgi:methylenetetrahydrofolate dehydrogenase (NADP+)/methenyltetrahydrofolate cyclohydrolase
MAVLLDGEALAAQCRAEIRDRAEASPFVRAGAKPCLATILVGTDEASHVYVARKHRDCEELGFASRQIALPATSSEADVLALVESLNRDPGYHGIVVQFPLPPHLDPGVFQTAIDPAKDVDGLHPLNLGRMMLGLPGLRPCTPKGIITLLQRHHVPLAGRRVAIIGRGMLTGRPLATMLADPAIDAVPTLLHRGAGDLHAILRESDVIISAAGVPDLVRADMVRPGACVVGVGISYRDGQMISDIADDVAAVASHVTPRHGSVGPMTRAMLMSNLLDAALEHDPVP